jgi:hypothetical protein
MPTISRWEYTNVSAHLHRDEVDQSRVPFTEMLKELGDQGWEMVLAIESSAGYHRFFFKRPKE